MMEDVQKIKFLGRCNIKYFIAFDMFQLIVKYGTNLRESGTLLKKKHVLLRICIRDTVTLKNV